MYEKTLFINNAEGCLCVPKHMFFSYTLWKGKGGEGGSKAVFTMRKKHEGFPY